MPATGLPRRIARWATRSDSAPSRDHLDPTRSTAAHPHAGVDGAVDADFVALGLGGTNMMAMLWSVAMGRRAVGIELRGDPALGVHWNVREDFYHHIGLIDQLMLERYGEERVPKRGDGRLFSLHETFYTPHSEPGGIFADEVITGFLSALGTEGHTAGLIHNTEFIDDRFNGGEPQRVVIRLEPPKPPTETSLDMVGRSVADVLDGPSTFQIGASEALVMCRRYLELIEEMDLAAGLEPRVRLFLSHRVVDSEPAETSLLEWFQHEDGFVREPDGRMRLRIEAVRELDYRGAFRRVREPGTPVLDIGVPELFMIAQGFYSSDAERLGFRQEDIKVDHHDGRGPVVAQADYLAGLMEINVGARLRRRIASEFDKEGNEYWVRQLAVGHEEDPEVGWILVQVPDFKTFDPILAGIVPAGTPSTSEEYVAAHQYMLRSFYLDQVALVTEIPRADLEEIQMPYGPKLFSLVERMGPDARVAANGVVAGDSFGNGHFLTSGGAMTGMVGHAVRVLEYWRARDAGASAEDAICDLAGAIKRDTEDWLAVSAQEFSESAPINFGDERIDQIARATGRDRSLRARAIDATRRHRHGLVPLNASDWRRLVVRAGKLHTYDLPPLPDTHPLCRDGALARDGSSCGDGTDRMHAGSMDAAAAPDDMGSMSAARASGDGEAAEGGHSL